MCLDIQGLVNDNEMSINECILCGECIEVRPKDVIEYRFGREKHGEKK